MTDPAFKKFNEYLPYLGKEWDVLWNDYPRAGLLCFPESIDPNQSGDPRYGLKISTSGPTKLSDESKSDDGGIEDLSHNYTATPGLTELDHESTEDYEYRKQACESDLKIGGCVKAF